MYGLRRSGGYRGGALLDILTKPPAIENKEALMVSILQWKAVSVDSTAVDVFVDSTVEYDELIITVPYSDDPRSARLHSRSIED